jgi:hypothetical protein
LGVPETLYEEEVGVAIELYVENSSGIERISRG